MGGLPSRPSHGALAARCRGGRRTPAWPKNDATNHRRPSPGADPGEAGRAALGPLRASNRPARLRRLGARRARLSRAVSLLREPGAVGAGPLPLW